MSTMRLGASQRSEAEARLLEPFALVWIHLAVRQKMGTSFAFRLMHR